MITKHETVVLVAALMFFVGGAFGIFASGYGFSGGSRLFPLLSAISGLGSTVCSFWICHAYLADKGAPAVNNENE